MKKLPLYPVIAPRLPHRPPPPNTEPIWKAAFKRELDGMGRWQLETALITARTELAFEKLRVPRDEKRIAHLETVVAMIRAEQLSRKLQHVDCFGKAG